MRRLVSLLVLAALVAAGALLYRNKDTLLAMAGPGTATTAPAGGTPAPVAGQQAASGPGAGPGGPPGAPGGPGARAPRQPAAVITVLAESRDMPIVVSAVGWVEASATAAVRTRVDGYVLKQSIADGQMVKQGDVLFQLDDAAIQATIAQHRAAHDRDQATVNQLTNDVARLQALADQNVATRTQLDQAKTNLAVAQANLQADKAILQADQIQLGYTTITAPIAGRVGVVSTTPGALVRANEATPLVTITRMAPVRITFNVPQRQLEAMRTALAGPTPAAVNAYDTETGAHLSLGRLSFVDSTLDVTTGSVMVKAEFANADGKLWPGQYLRAETQVGTHQNATVVPQSAVQINANGAFVYLVRNERAVLQPVAVAEYIGESALINTGVRAGDHVIVEGAVRIANNAQVVETLRGRDGAMTPVAGGGQQLQQRPPAEANATPGAPGGQRPPGQGFQGQAGQGAAGGGTPNQPGGNRVPGAAGGGNAPAAVGAGAAPQQQRQAPAAGNPG